MAAAAGTEQHLVSQYIFGLTRRLMLNAAVPVMLQLQHLYRLLAHQQFSLGLLSSCYLSPSLRCNGERCIKGKTKEVQVAPPAVAL